MAPVDVAAAQGAVRPVDVRQPAEFTGELGHVPGALPVPLAGLLAAASAWDRDAPIVVICRTTKRPVLDNSSGSAVLGDQRGGSK